MGNYKSDLLRYLWLDTIRQVRLHSPPPWVLPTDACGQSIDFGTVANSITIWLLPWISLTAQLPYEADGFSANLMSLLLAIGSPALITFSLAITAFNRRWIRKRVHCISEQVPLKFDSKFSHFKPAVEGANSCSRSSTSSLALLRSGRMAQQPDSLAAKSALVDRRHGRPHQNPTRPHIFSDCTTVVRRLGIHIHRGLKHSPVRLAHQCYSNVCQRSLGLDGSDLCRLGLRRNTNQCGSLPGTQTYSCS